MASIPKVTPEVMMIVYLDEIAGRLGELYELQEKQTAEGWLRSGSHSVSEEPLKFVVAGRYMSLHNEGANPFYLMQRKGKPIAGEAPIRAAGEFNLDMGTRGVRSFWMVCDAGLTTTVSSYIW